VDPDLLNKLLNGGLAGLIIVGGVRKWFVFGWQYEEQKARADKNEDLLEKALEALHSSTNHIESTQR
jgi:hypothetical protein